ncbi:MAG: lectin like domain-containing protein, partial [Ruminococcus sp.]
QFETSSLNEFTSTYFNSDIFIGVDHAVAVVGWDDNYPRENCEVNGVMPYEDGAWLIKNSWGTSSGNNGYYWVSYEDTSINNYPVSFYSLEYADNYDNNYQYDDIFNTDACFDDYDDLIGIVGGGTMANVYTARKDEEVLKAVGFFTQNENLTYEIDIYRGVDENGMPQGEPVASKKGTEQYMGYHTVNLDSPVSLEKGEKFVVAIKLYDETTPDIPIVFSIDSVVFDDRYTKNTEYGESLFMYSGGEWFDIKDCVNCNFRIKAFTDSKEEESAPAEDLYYSFGGVSRDELKYELGKKYSDALEIAYNSFGVYSSDSLSELQNIVSYVESGMLSDYSDLFLAMDFSSASDEIDRCIDALEPFDISELIGDYYVDDESIPLISTLDGYENYINAYNSVVERAEDEGVNYENAIEFIEIASKAYLDIMHEAVRAGFNFSYLQNFGDADNNGNVNIKDCTLIQKYLVNLVESDYYIINNANVDRDYDITIKDVTAIQKYIADIIEYMPVYDTQFGIDESGTLPEPTAVDKETAIANLQNAVDAVEMVYGEDLLMTFTEVSYLTVGVMLSDAKEVLNSPEDYHPQVIDFKARNLLWCYSSIGAAG